ncbi:T9SS type A sorting domain-containing protein [Chryseobacterium sp. RP-3-3]|uniref:T9SS type A sorting domain-containing protein n=1 Tax=Chryseobacterium antibioticum TaxID=2728847 RepID=A0A7Y0FQD4_9FLAO|nr:T9SS type A sorting domain-containing protein [Chryseobacterium antibioticum]
MKRIKCFLGMYLLEIKTKNKVVTEKFIKK